MPGGSVIAVSLLIEPGSAVAIFLMFRTGVALSDIAPDQTAISYSPPHWPSHVILLISTLSLVPFRTVDNLLHWSVLFTDIDAMQLCVVLL